jgi:hypothetical protein
MWAVKTLRVIVVVADERKNGPASIAPNRLWENVVVVTLRLLLVTPIPPPMTVSPGFAGPFSENMLPLTETVAVMAPTAPPLSNARSLIVGERTISDGQLHRVL